MQAKDVHAQAKAKSMASEKIMEEMPEGLLSNEKLPLDLPEDYGATPSQIEASRPSQVQQPFSIDLARLHHGCAFQCNEQGCSSLPWLQGTPAIMPPMPSPGPAPRHLPGEHPFHAAVLSNAIPAVQSSCQQVLCTQLLWQVEQLGRQMVA